MKGKRSLIETLLCVAVLQAVTSGAQPVTKVATGGDGDEGTDFSLFLKSDGSLWGTGMNWYGELGNGTTNSVNRPVQILANGVTTIAAGEGHSLFLKSDGSLWGMGMNSGGQLGDGHAYSTFLSGTNRPEQIVASNVTAIAAGFAHSLFLKGDGSLWGMGDNLYGQLGDGTYRNIYLPEQIVGSNVTAIAAGRCYSLFIKSDGSLWGMGWNQYGQLGNGTYNSTNRPVQSIGSNVTAIAVGGYCSLFLTSDGGLWIMGMLDAPNGLSYGCRPCLIDTEVTKISAGWADCLYLKSGGSLWGRGGNGNGELGNCTYTSTITNFVVPQQIQASGVTAIAAGYCWNLFVKADGSLWGMGWNGDGELGDGSPFGCCVETNCPEQIVVGTPGYNQISGQLVSGGCMRLSYVGMAGTNYALDRSFSLTPANWMPQVTNSASVGGVLVFTNTPDPATNNFWRIRSVP